MFSQIEQIHFIFKYFVHSIRYYKKLVKVTLPASELMNTRTLHLRPHVALTCFAFLSWFSGIVMIQQATRTFLANSSARVASPLWDHSSGLWNPTSALGEISLTGGGLKNRGIFFSFETNWKYSPFYFTFSMIWMPLSRGYSFKDLEATFSNHIYFWKNKTI